MSKKIKVFPCWILLVVIFVSLFLFTKIGFFIKTNISISTIFSGLLALVGFLFTARTFITFKLHEVIYGNPQYREFVKQAKEEGAYKKNLYDPLKSLDKDLATATVYCLIAAIVFFIFSFFPEAPTEFKNLYLFQEICKISFYQLPKVWYAFVIQFISAFAFSYFISTVWYLVEAIKSINNNITSIIDHWENESKDDSTSKDER